MDVTCNVIEDLLPLYADGICSEDSKTIIEHHTAVCAECKEKLDSMTAKLEKNEESPTPENPFKKARTHYVRLIAITLCIAVLIAVPSVICSILTINDMTNVGVSWSTLKSERKMRSIGNMMKDGSYLKAVDELLSDGSQYGYSNEKFSEIKALIADDFKNYFAVHPIEKIRVFARKKATGEVYGYLHLEIKNEYGGSHFPVLNIPFEDGIPSCEGFGLDFVKGYDKDRSGYDKYYSTADYEVEYGAYEFYYHGFPDMFPVSADHAEKYFSRLFNTEYDEKNMGIIVSQKYFSDVFGTGQWRQIEIQKFEEFKSFSDNFNYIGCNTGNTSYQDDGSDRERLVERCYFQHATLKFLCDGDVVTVECDVPFSIWYAPAFRLSAVRNIVYSDNATESFKEQFENIFAY